MERVKKIGIMGGTFDPVHIGHLMIADCALEQLKLDRVLFIPAGNPPHKRHRIGGASDEDRTEMVRLAIADHPGFALSLTEMEKKEPSYTYQTLEQLKASDPDTEYYFIIGADSLYDLKDWKEPARICRAAVIVVAARNHTDRKLLEFEIRRTEECFGGRFLLLDMDCIDVSSTILRQKIRSGRTIRYFVPRPVYDYIHKHHLYETEEVESD